MKVVKQFTVGQSAQSVALPNGALVKGIQVDNPTGGWLYVVSEQAYVPPYTVGWALPTSYDQTSVTINYGNGPSGQVGTNNGDPWTLTLTDEAVPQSDGSPYQFTSGFTPKRQLSVVGQSTSVLNGSGGTLVTSAAGKRIRLFTVSMLQYSQILTGPVDSECIVWLNVQGGQYLMAEVLEGVDAKTFSFGDEGFDLPIASDLLWSAQPIFSGAFLSIFATYQLI